MSYTYMVNTPDFFFFLETDSIAVLLHGCGTQGIARQQPRFAYNSGRSYQGLHYATNCEALFYPYAYHYYYYLASGVPF